MRTKSPVNAMLEAETAKIRAWFERFDHTNPNYRKELGRAVVTIFRNQTNIEQGTETTLLHNGMGFRPSDAKFLSSLAKWHQSGKILTEKQAFVAAKRMVKYSGQLARMKMAGNVPNPDDDHPEPAPTVSVTKSVKTVKNDSVPVSLSPEIIQKIKDDLINLLAPQISKEIGIDPDIVGDAILTLDLSKYTIDD